MGLQLVGGGSQVLEQLAVLEELVQALAELAELVFGQLGRRRGRGGPLSGASTLAVCRAQEGV